MEEDIIIAGPNSDMDSDADDRSTMVASDNFGDMTEISIHTPGGDHIQNISSPLDLKFVTLDESSDEDIKDEEEALEDTETFGRDDDYMVEEDSDVPVALNKLVPNSLVEVAFNNCWFPARVLCVVDDQKCIVLLLDSFLAIWHDVTGMPVEVGAGRVKPLKRDRGIEKVIPLSNLVPSEVALKLNTVADLTFDEGMVKLSLSCRGCWNAWDLVWQKLATCKGFVLDEFLQSEDHYLAIYEEDGLEEYQERADIESSEGMFVMEPDYENSEYPGEEKEFSHSQDASILTHGPTGFIVVAG